MKKLSMICMAALLLLAASCKKEKKIELGDGIGFRATTEAHGGNSKTHLDGLKVIWDMDDEILVYSSNGGGGKYGTPETFRASVVDGSTAGFSSTKSEGLAESFYTPPYKAYYPASGIVDASQPDRITLPATQTYAANSFAPGANPMVAKAEDVELAFKNICGVLELQLYSTTACQVRSISITSNTGEKLCGTGTVDFDTDNNPTLALSDGGSTLTLDMGSTGELMDTSESQSSAYYFVVPVNTLGTSFTVKVTETGGKEWTKTANAPANLIARSQITVLPKQAVATKTPVVPSEVTVTASCSNEDIYTLGGSVTVPDGPHNCEFGLVYSDSDNTPTIEEGAQKVVAGTAAFSGTQSFTVDITGLTVGTTYHVRAYAMIDGVTYSTGVKDIVGGDGPQTMTWTGGKSPKQFSVSTTKKVYFSQGNLQYIGSVATPYWKFADHQFDFIGNGQNGSSASDIDRDLFGWGTSGWNNGNHFYQPYDTDYDTYSESVGFGYGPTDGTSYNFSLTGDYANADWGVNCAISNGGNQAGKWRTLTGGSSGEWYYLINSRSDAANLYGEGKVGDCTPGLIILPDDWKWEGDVAGFEASWKPGETAWSNVYSYSDWAKMEAAGAVFLPAAGYRDGTSVDNAGSYGYYWSSSYSASNYAYNLYFWSGNVIPYYNNFRSYGFSVRLVSEN